MARHSRGRKYYKTYSTGRKIRRVIFLFLLGIFAIAAGAGLGFGYYGYNLFQEYQAETPKLDLNKLLNPVPSEIYDTNGILVAKIGKENRIEVKPKDIPKQYYDALVATEDSRFFEHNGFDPVRILKAAYVDIKARKTVEGGSTLTQQLVKLTYLDPNEDSLKRKTQEVTLAQELEKHYTKEEILSMYINKIYMGNSNYGVQTAAEYYFRKNLKELSLAQVAFLAGVPQSPSEYDPYVNPDSCTWRRNIVLQRMLATKKITKTQYNQAHDTPITDGLVPKEQQALTDSEFTVPKKYQRYVDMVITEVGKNTKLDVMADGLKIYTGLNVNAQVYANKLVNTNEFYKWPDTKQLLGYTVINNADGTIVSTGDGNRETKVVVQGYNYATQAQRQPGSSIKPVLDYAPAVEYLGWSNSTRLVDEPYKYSSGIQVYNWDHGYKGSITMAQALAMSRNIPAIKALQQVGLKRAYTFANTLGMGYDSSQFVESGAIGGVSNANSLKMAQAYSAFARQGTYVKGHTVTKITKISNGKTVYTQAQPKAVMKKTTADTITIALRQTLNASYGTGTAARIPGVDIAGKTGTTNYGDDEITKFKVPDGNTPDAWFVGYTRQYTIAIWTGYDARGSSLNTTQRNLPQQLFKSILQNLPLDKTAKIP